MTKKLFRFTMTLCAVSTLAEAVDYKKLSDTLVGSLPLAALSATLWLDDREGTRAFALVMGTDLLVTGGLKYTIPATRPDGGPHSFPSGHTSVAFTSAAFVHKRYGWRYALPMYALSALTAYSRIRARKHYLRDVAAGALLGTGIGYLMTKRFRGIAVRPGTSRGAMGITLTRRW